MLKNNSDPSLLLFLKLKLKQYKIDSQTKENKKQLYRYKIMSHSKMNTIHSCRSMSLQ